MVADYTHGIRVVVDDADGTMTTWTPWVEGWGWVGGWGMGEFLSRYLTSHLILEEKIPRPRHMSVFCHHVNDTFTLIMTRVPSSVILMNR